MAMDSQTLLQAFEHAQIVVDDDAVAELLSMAREHKAGATWMAESWEAFVMCAKNKKLHAKAGRSSMDQFRSYVVKHAPKPESQDGYRFTSSLELAEDDGTPPIFTRTPAPSRKSVGSRVEVSESPPEMAPSAAVAIELLPQLQTPAGGTPFSKRASKLVGSAALNGHLEAIPPVADKMDIDGDFVEQLLQGVPCGARFLSERLEGKVDYLEGMITAFVETLVDDFGLAATSPVHSAAPDVVVTAGRVICDSDGRLNEASLLLEGNIQHSNGARVKLEMRELQSFSAFPGQVIAVEGINPSGFCLVAKNVVSSLPPPLAPASEGPAAAAASSPVSLVVAAGPFSCNEDLIYEPLEEVLDYCRRNRPDALLLVGPFVDADHPLVASGLLDCSFAELFDLQLRARLDTFCEEIGPSCRVILVPSVRDAHHDSVFPQPPLSSTKFECPAGQVVCAPNPCMLRIGGVVVGATSADILKHMSAAETSRENDKRTDRMGRLAAHLVAQRSFYPLTPPAVGTCLDSSLAPVGLTMPFRPDVLVLPSDLASFAKAVPLDIVSSGPAAGFESTATSKPAPQPGFVCVNPGRAAKGATGGSFAHLHVRPAEEGQTTPLVDRTRVDIIRV